MAHSPREVNQAIFKKGRESGLFYCAAVKKKPGRSRARNMRITSLLFSDWASHHQKIAEAFFDCYDCVRTTKRHPKVAQHLYYISDPAMLPLFFRLKLQRRIQKHHQYKAAQKCERCQILVTVIMGFRYNFIADNKQHGTSGKSQRPGHQRFQCSHRHSSQ